MLLSDVVAFAVSVVAGLAVAAFLTRKGTTPGTHLVVGTAFVALSLASFILRGLYTRIKRRIVVSAHDDLRDILEALILAALLTAGANHVFLHKPLRPSQLVAVVVVGFVAVPLGRSATVSLFDVVRRERLLIVGTGSVADSVARRLSRERDQGIEIVGLVDDDPMDGSSVLGGLADLPRLCEEHGVSRVLVAFSRTPPHETAEILRRLAPRVAISVVPRLYELVCWRSQLDELYGIPMMDVAPPQLTLPARIGKRAFDVAASLAGLVITSPLMIFLAVVIKLTSSGSAMFVQSRAGKHGKVFSIVKFRTMRVGAERERDDLITSNEVDGPLFKMKEDPRRTAIGRFLRQTSLDELPQLFNVLKGDMSLVGPRPFVVEESERIDGWAARRLDVRPGITGLWQVSGRNDLSYSELRALDYAYVASWSLWWDLRILAQTPAIVLKRRGAH